MLAASVSPEESIRRKQKSPLSERISDLSVDAKAIHVQSWALILVNALSPRL